MIKCLIKIFETSVKFNLYRVMLMFGENFIRLALFFLDIYLNIKNNFMKISSTSIFAVFTEFVSSFFTRLKKLLRIKKTTFLKYQLHKVSDL